MATRILIVDDHAILREGLRVLIREIPGMEVEAECETGRDAVRLAIRQSPDVVLMDISMPDLNGIEATRQIVAALPSCRVIALSMHAEKRLILEILKAGASGYVLKNIAFSELAAAIRTVLRGKTYLSPEVSEIFITDYVRDSRLGEDDVFSRLSAREREVLQLLAEGNSTVEIADRLHVSVKTVETHRQRIMEKTNIRTVAGLTKYAVREGLTSL